MSWGPSLAWTQKPHQRRPLGPPRKGIGETRPSGCARKRSSRRSFPLDTADFVRDVLLDRAGLAPSPLAVKPAENFHEVLVRMPTRVVVKVEGWVGIWWCFPLP